MAKRDQPSAKNKAAKQQKAAADKTFGLKNKNKSSKVQAFVKQVEEQTRNAGADKRKQAEAERRAAEKKAAEQAKREAAELFKPVMVQKVPFGVDPKSVLCAYFKQGTCTKGNKCKFSHDLNVGRKTEKKDLYADDKDNEEKQKDGMEDWDDEKLRSVVLSKHGNAKTTTDIVCKYFIEAVENSKYGWFWTCPNGGDNCKYRHSLPPGFKLKTKEERRLERLAESEKPTFSMEEFIEIERKKLPEKLTPVTFDSFMKWKSTRDKKKAEDEMRQAVTELSGKQLMETGKYLEDDYKGDTFDVTQMREDLESDEENEEHPKADEEPLSA